METKFYFFSGKGGVGKTVMAAATAVYFANRGKKTLIITTDPASNLADVFGQSIGHKITPIKILRTKISRSRAWGANMAKLNNSPAGIIKEINKSLRTIIT